MNNATMKWVWSSVSFFWMYWSMTLFTSASGTSVLPKGMEKALTNLYTQYYIFVNGFIAFGLLTGVFAFIVLFMQLGSTAQAHPMARMFILREMMVVGITTALLGGFPLIFVLYLNMYN